MSNTQTLSTCHRRDIRTLRLTAYTDFTLLSEAATGADRGQLASATREANDARAYIQYLMSQCSPQITSPAAPPGLTAVLLSVVRAIKTEEHVSISTLQTKLKEDESIDDNLRAFEPDRLERLIFCAIGWTTMLYVPSNECVAKQYEFGIDPSHLTESFQTSIPQVARVQPIGEFLRLIGDPIPTSLSTESRDSGVKITLRASDLNASALRRIGRFTIKWVNCLSSHLEVDTRTDELYLFSLPAFCTTNMGDVVLSS
jgi:hypothetical protein